jgi:hypothetical protein
VALLDPHGNETGRQYSNDIIVSMTKRFDAAHQAWNKGIAKFNQHVGIFNQDEFGPVFKYVVDLFRGNASSGEPIKELHDLYTSHSHEIEFYIPEITTFLLYGSFGNYDALQELILDLCSKSPNLAHKVRWFIVSFSLSGAGVGRTGVNALNVFLKQVEQAGISAAKLQLPQSVFAQETEKEGASNDRDVSIDRPSTMLSVPLSKSSEAPASPRTRPMDKGEGAHKLDSYPFDQTVEIRRNDAGFISAINGFTPTIEFWDELVRISRVLCPLPKDSRTPELRKMLEQFQEAFLPSAVIFSPVGRQQHR